MSIYSILSNNFRTVIASAAGLAFVTYAFYYDHKRRSAPDYKESIRRNRKQKQNQSKHSRTKALDIEFPDPRNMASCQAFLFEQISLGETLLENGRVDEAIIHLSNAAIASGQPSELLQIFQQTVPPEVFIQLVNAIPAAKIRQNNSVQKFFGTIDAEVKIEDVSPIVKDELDLE